ncbi:MAG TPA: hypothetical protein VGG84_16410 [Gemmatimonadaceae bacterium]|jgi:hypothetical protein
MVCTHDLGPGTKVCLRCRQEQRDVDRARQQRLLVKVGVIGLGLVFAYVAGASVVTAVRGASTAARKTEPPPTMLATTEVVQQGHGSVDAPRMERAPAASQTAAPSPVSAPLSIIIPAGRTDTVDDVILERTGDSVVVDFDTDIARTRRGDKFDRIVRQTLPLVYGPRVDPVLAAIPAGTLANDGDLVTELPARGIHLPLSDGWMLDVFPETRPGRDGPLVVTYRTRLRKI